METVKENPFESDTVENGYVIYLNGILLPHNEVEKMLNDYFRLKELGRFVAKSMPYNYADEILLRHKFKVMINKND